MWIVSESLYFNSRYGKTLLSHWRWVMRQNNINLFRNSASQSRRPVHQKYKIHECKMCSLQSNRISHCFIGSWGEWSKQSQKDWARDGKTNEDFHQLSTWSAHVLSSSSSSSSSPMVVRQIQIWDAIASAGGCVDVFWFCNASHSIHSLRTS